MVITGIMVLTLIVFITVGVLAKKHQEKKAKKEEYELQMYNLSKFGNELESHITLGDIFAIHRQLGLQDWLGIEQSVLINTACSELLI